MWVGGQRHFPAALPPRNEPSVSIGSQDRSGLFGERTNMLTVPGFDTRFPGSPEYTLVSVKVKISLEGIARSTNLRCRVAVVCLRNGCYITDPSDLLVSEDYLPCRLSHYIQ